MKKSIYFIGLILGFIILISSSMAILDKFYYRALEKAYMDSVGEKLFVEKFQGVDIQKIIFSNQSNVGMFGSSELSSYEIPTHPVNTFSQKAADFQIVPIGRGYSQSIIHAINFAALKDTLKGKKLMFIISPQWFTPEGLDKNNFPINFSEIQYYKMMFDMKLSAQSKQYISKRVKELTDGNESLKQVNFCAKVNSSEDFSSKVLRIINKPNYFIRYKTLSIKDKVATIKAIKDIPEAEKHNNNKVIKDFDWQQELSKVEVIAKEKTTNNDFFIDNSYYDKYVKEKFSQSKGIYKQQSYLNSPEYNDLKVLLDICKENSIKPLFVSVPVHGKWYDYCEFPKEDREKYYKNINSIIKSYDFDLLDLSKYEYEPYFLKDIMHLGWKGWIQIDKEINEYYHSNR